LALDELRDGDESFDTGDLKFVVEKEFFEKIKPVSIDYVVAPQGEGFNISSSLPRPEEDACSSCTSC
jgi:Fe-S cluster assembly iron-binding protein IscA